MARLFIAAELSKPARELAEEAERYLRGALRRQSRVRWTQLDGRHLTLVFLGQVDGTGLERAAELMQQTAARHGPFTVEVGGLGAFPSARRASVLWIGVHDTHGKLLPLANALRDGCRQQRFEVDDREYRGHVTLGRVADRTGLDLTQELEAGPAQRVVVEVDVLTLFESQLAPSGARYRSLRVARLGAT